MVVLVSAISAATAHAAEVKTSTRMTFSASGAGHAHVRSYHFVKLESYSNPEGILASLSLRGRLLSHTGNMIDEVDVVEPRPLSSSSGSLTSI